MHMTKQIFMQNKTNILFEGLLSYVHVDFLLFFSASSCGNNRYTDGGGHLYEHHLKESIIWNYKYLSLF